MDVANLSKRLGHANAFQTMSTYCHASVEHEQVGVEEMGALLRGGVE